MYERRVAWWGVALRCVRRCARIRGGELGRGEEGRRRKRERKRMSYKIKSAPKTLHSNQTARHPRRRKQVRIWAKHIFKEGGNCGVQRMGIIYNGVFCVYLGAAAYRNVISKVRVPLRHYCTIALAVLPVYNDAVADVYLLVPVCGRGRCWKECNNLGRP